MDNNLSYTLFMANRAGLRKLGPKNNIPEVSLTKKSKKRLFIWNEIHAIDMLTNLFNNIVVTCYAHIICMLHESNSVLFGNCLHMRMI